MGSEMCIRDRLSAEYALNYCLGSFAWVPIRPLKYRFFIYIFIDFSDFWGPSKIKCLLIFHDFFGSWGPGAFKIEFTMSRSPWALILDLLGHVGARFMTQNRF